eukprot:365277-Chlamydomonas_euryale.AAC.11
MALMVAAKYPRHGIDGGSCGGSKGHAPHVCEIDVPRVRTQPEAQFRNTPTSPNRMLPSQTHTS